MRFTANLLIAIGIATLLFGAGGTGLSAQQAAFRSSAEVVAVRAVVTREGRPVRGLTAKDFVVRDAGDLRPVEVADAGTLPVDLALVIDQGAHATLYSDSFSRELTEMPARLLPGDRLSVTLLGDGMLEVVSLDSAVEHRSATLRPGQPAPLDGIARALIVPVPAGRQRSVIFVGLAGDDSSVLDYEAVLRLARATPAGLFVALGNWRIVNGGVAGSGILQRRFETGAMYWDFDERRTSMIWAESRDLGNISARAEDDHRRRIVALAESTGGRELRWRGGSLRSAVEQALTESREGYMLYFHPLPAATPGWHPIQVEVPGQKGLRISARAGYVR